MTPFHDFCLFKGFYGFFKFPKHSGADRIDRRTKSIYCLTGIKIEYILKIFMLKIVVRILSNAAVHCIGYAVCHCGLKSYLNVIFIILLKEAICNDVEDRLFEIVPILSGKVDCDIFQLIFQNPL